MNYDVSDFKNRITFYMYEGESDGAGGKYDNWDDKKGYVKLLSRWADVIPLSGRSLYQSKMMSEETTHDVIIRFNKQLTHISSSLISIDYKGKRLDVDYMIDIDNEHKFLRLRCTENYGKKSS